MQPTHDAVDLSRMDEVFAQYLDQKGALIPILQRAQAIYGYLPPEVLQHIADRLNISVSRAYGVATFYSQFYLEEKGRHTLRICDGTACHVKGAPELLGAVEDRYGIGRDATTDDGELTLEIVYCLGSCALAPVAVLDGQVVGRLKGDALLRRVEGKVAAP